MKRESLKCLVEAAQINRPRFCPNVAEGTNNFPHPPPPTPRPTFKSATPHPHPEQISRDLPAPPSSRLRTVSELTVQGLIWSRRHSPLRFPLYQRVKKLDHQLPHLGHTRQQALERVGVARRLTGDP